LRRIEQDEDRVAAHLVVQADNNIALIGQENIRRPVAQGQLLPCWRRGRHQRLTIGRLQRRSNRPGRYSPS
jgi:hypothetical protein